MANDKKSRRDVPSRLVAPAKPSHQFGQTCRTTSKAVEVAERKSNESKETKKEK